MQRPLTEVNAGFKTLLSVIQSCFDYEILVMSFLLDSRENK